MRTAVLFDVHNLYVNCLRKFPGMVVNYPKLLQAIESEGNNDVFHAVAYGKQPEEKVAEFAKMLRRHGFQLVFGNTPHNIEMALKAAKLIQDRAIDKLILGTSNFEAGRILEYAKNHGIYTVATGFDLPKVFEKHADCAELTPEFLQPRGKNETAEPLDVHPNLPSDPGTASD